MSVNMNIKLSKLASIINGTLSGADGEFSDVTIDSRTVQNGSCFFAIKGDVFDGHDFIADVKKRGCSCRG